MSAKPLTRHRSIARRGIVRCSYSRCVIGPELGLGAQSRCCGRLVSIPDAVNGTPEWQFWPQFAASMLWLLSARKRCLISARRAMSLTALLLPTAGGGGGIVAYGFQPGWRVGAGGGGGILSA